MTLLDRLLRRPAVPGWLGPLLEEDEFVLVTARAADGTVVATSHGVWLPEQRRIGWHLVSKATWAAGTLTLIEAVEEPLGGAALLSDRPERRLSLADPGKLPQTVQRRVEDSIRSRHRRDLPGGGVWLVQRKLPGKARVVLQVRPDPGTDADAVRRVVAEVTRTIGLDH
ncbi:MAG TPA: hypothetical protein VIQ30_19050 [Pseudonocardia sp.]